MGYIKEPDGVDFIIKGEPLTDKQKKDISKFIRADKEKLKLKESKDTKTIKEKKANQPT